MKPTLLTLAAILTLVCSSWKKDDPMKVFPKEIREHWSYVPFLAYPMDGITQTTEDFYISKFEVTNYEYRVFLHSEFVQNNPERLAIATPDTLVWREPFSYCEPYMEYYFRHPAYNDYPMVGVTGEAAELYCEFLTLELRHETGFLNLIADLPTRPEWAGAAKGGIELSPYPWGGPYLKNAKGCFLANFQQVGEGAITRNPESGEMELLTPEGMDGYPNMDNGDITVPVDSYAPNDYEIYCMAGNVAEIVKGDSIVCGGGWRSGGYDLKCTSYQAYVGAAVDVGFRPIIRLK